MSGNTKSNKANASVEAFRKSRETTNIKPGNAIDARTFKEAFNKARAKRFTTFIYKGKEYNTQTEKDAESAESRAAWQKKYNVDAGTVAGNPRVKRSTTAGWEDKKGYNAGRWVNGQWEQLHGNRRTYKLGKDGKYYVASQSKYTETVSDSGDTDYSLERDGLNPEVVRMASKNNSPGHADVVVGANVHRPAERMPRESGTRFVPFNIFVNPHAVPADWQLGHTGWFKM